MLKLLKHHIVHPRRARLIQKGILDESRRGHEINRSSFPGSLVLPARFGTGLPERVVEQMLVRLLYRPGAEILDIGHANAMPSHRSTLLELPGPRRLTGLDIAEPVYDTAHYYQRSLREDITESSIPDASFDQVWCVSTLEHFGMDNSAYTSSFVQDAGLAAKSMSAMMRLLKPGGSLLITVPYGRLENHGSHINYDHASWIRLLDPWLSHALLRTWYFRHTYGAGWQIVKPEELSFTGYYDQSNSGAAGLAAALLTKRT